MKSKGDRMDTPLSTGSKLGEKFRSNDSEGMWTRWQPAD